MGRGRRMLAYACIVMFTIILGFNFGGSGPTYSNAVLAVWGSEGSHYTVIGSGAFVDGGVYTAGHVAEILLRSVHPAFACDQQFEECVLLVEPPLIGSTVDYAFYPLDELPSTIAPAKIALLPVDKRDRISTMGCPQGTCGFYAEGVVSNVYEDGTFFSTMLTIPGMSGGGIYNEHGRLVGLVTGFISLTPDPLYGAIFNWNTSVDLTQVPDLRDALPLMGIIDDTTSDTARLESPPSDSDAGSH